MGRQVLERYVIGVDLDRRQREPLAVEHDTSPVHAADRDVVLLRRHDQAAFVGAGR